LSRYAWSHNRKAWVVALTGILAVVLSGSTALAQATSSPAAVTAADDITTSTPADYSCFVTYQGGSTTVSYSLTFTATAPDTVAPYTPFTAEIAAPVITPNPNINVFVQQVRVVYLLPSAARLLSAQLSGGSGLGAGGAKLSLAAGAVILTAPGPFQGNVPFQLPAVDLKLLAGGSGSASISQGGLTLADPAFSWTRSDPNGGTLRPFGCFSPAPVTLSTTTIAS
jgi:dehydratase